MDPVVDLAPGAESIDLGVLLASIVRDNVATRPRARAELESLRGSVAIVADDAPSTLTLRFDYGRLTVHAGVVGIPDMTIRGRTSTLEALPELAPADGRLLDAVLDKAHRAKLSRALGLLRKGDLKVYGLSRHPHLMLKVLRLLARS